MDTTTEAEVGVGEEYKLRLPGLGAAGYRWSLAPGQGDRPVTVRTAPAPSPPSSSPPPPGASADETFLVSASEPGEFSLRFEQRRPWESGQPAHQSHTLILRVR